MVTRLIKPSINNGFARNASECEVSARSLWGGKLAHWVPGLGVQGQVLYDISGYNNKSTLTNGPQYIVGEKGLVLDFDGDDDFTVSDRDVLIASDPITIAMWVKYDGYSSQGSSYNVFIARDNITTNNQSYGIFTTSDNKARFVRKWGVTAAISNDSIADGEWHFLVGIYLGMPVSGALQIWVDGVKGVDGNAATTTLTGVGQKIYIGCDNQSSRNANASIDNVRMYNRVLYPSEIWQLYMDPFADLRRDIVLRAKAIGGVPPTGRIMSSLVNAGGLAGYGGIAGRGGGLAG